MTDANNCAWDAAQDTALTKLGLDGLPSARPTWAGSFLCATFENDTCYAPEVMRAAKRLVWLCEGRLIQGEALADYVHRYGWD